MCSLFLRSFIVCFTLAAAVQAGDVFPEWRGVDGQGHSDAKNLPVQFSEADVAWKHKIPGLGWSTPVIVDGKEIGRAHV